MSLPSVKRAHLRYSSQTGVRPYPTHALRSTRTSYGLFTLIVTLLMLALGNVLPMDRMQHTASVSSAPGQDYEICDEQSQLTSPWSYRALASGSHSYTVQQYEELNTDGTENATIPGSAYGTTLPTLPAYISSESPLTTAAEIFAPGSTVSNPAYDYPETPMLYFFEGGSYGPLALDSISGDEFIGGSASGYTEPVFNNAGNAGGINGQNGSFDFSGGSSALAATANAGATTVTTTSTIPGYIQYVTFPDGTTYSIASASGTSIALNSALTNTETAGSDVWGSRSQPIAYLSAAASQRSTTISLGSSSMPEMEWANVVVGADTYQIQSVSGSQSGYTLTLSGGLDTAAGTGTPIYYNGLSGGVDVAYLNINDDQHLTTGTLYTGSGWTIEHNDIHDGYSKGAGYGVAIYGGDNGTIEYNCLSKMGDYGMNIFGNNDQFDYNEVYESNYKPDPGCGCSGGGKWWGTLNANIENNAFINDGIGGGGAIWLDNGNTGTLISGNYFDQTYGQAISSETGFNLDVTNNLFLDDGWGSGSGCGNSNCAGDVSINTSGGFEVPGSRYENEILISGNHFINDWGGVGIWQAGSRSCENSGEGWPDDANYCSGGYPVTESTAANTTSENYYFSHDGDTNHGDYVTLAQSASAGDSTVLIAGGAEAIDDQIGFSDPVATTTSDTADVSTFTGSGTVSVASTAGFSSAGQLRVGTTDAWSDGGGSYTGAILSYTGTTSTTFTGVSLVRGTGSLVSGGPIQEVQPYKVTSEVCYTNDCSVSITPALSSNETAGAEVSNAGTCQLYATSAATPTSPLAPDSISYWDGCQWEAKDISVNNNTFTFQPSVIAHSAPVAGGSTTACTASHSNDCGTNFMADQPGGEAPFNNQIGANAMMSSSSFSGCPSWDSGCSTDPLANINALSNPPNAAIGNGEPADNNVWSNNTYVGPWLWNAFIYGNCTGSFPTDSDTSKTAPSDACSTPLPQWQSDWQQDAGSTYNPMSVSLSGLTSDQVVHGTQSVTAYEDTTDGDSITSTLSVGNNTAATVSSLNTSPYIFSLNTTSYADGQYTLQVSGKDNSEGGTNNDSLPVYITNGDLNGDGKVNLSDLIILAQHYGKSGSFTYSQGNITGATSGSEVNLSDLIILAKNYGYDDGLGH